ncbi:hypothetical protein L2U69_15490 [Zavarzinia compransoris]|uniref:hypothetical protein n=1 Tax=Zavarzinia marina TaxID=2911065 RepID=UPI001F485BAF|nr:hypothetical protein [Zavarzinia marina]MCF4167056.1 hypothetical protein [Zavarzinia marina]
MADFPFVARVMPIRCPGIRASATAQVDALDHCSAAQGSAAQGSAVLGSAARGGHALADVAGVGRDRYLPRRCEEAFR